MLCRLAQYVLFILSIDYIYKRDAIRYFFCVFIASLFHGSALILLPVFLLGFFNWNINKVRGISIFSIYLSLFLLGESLQIEINEFINQYFARYNVYEGGGKLGTGLGLIFLSCMFSFILYHDKFQKKENSLLFKIAFLSFIFLPLGLIIMMIVRVAMYFQPVIIVVYPLVVISIKESWLKFSFILFLVLFSLYGFIQFFQSEIWREAFGTYQTIFSAPEIY